MHADEFFFEHVQDRDQGNMYKLNNIDEAYKRAVRVTAKAAVIIGVPLVITYLY